MDDKNVIASAISDNELARAFSEMVADRWDNWDLSEFLPYLVDTVAPSALPYLADQFDIDGLQGFGMAETEQQQRDIIKKSIALHKFIGTPWAIREACRTVGFPIVILEESRKIHLFVEFYKNERSHLVEVGYYQRIEASEIVFNTNDWLNVEVTTRRRAFSAGFNRGFK